MTTLQLLQERRRAAMAQNYRDFEEQWRRDIHDNDEVDGLSQHGGSSGRVWWICIWYDFINQWELF